MVRILSSSEHDELLLTLIAIVAARATIVVRTSRADAKGNFSRKLTTLRR
jgi:hypothetical protein